MRSFVAQRLPNLFRSLFAEGAFSTAFVPLANRALSEGGKPALRDFAEEAYSVLFAALLGFVVLGEILDAVADARDRPGFEADPGKFALVVGLTRITFPYLLFISLVALQGGLLTRSTASPPPRDADRCLNLFLIAALVLMYRFAWRGGEALAWALTAAGIAQFLWLMARAAAAGVGLRLRRPRLTRGCARRCGDGAGGARRRGDPAQPGDLDRARLAAPGRLGLVSLLRRPAEPAAARRRRNRRGDGDPAAACRGRCAPATAGAAATQNRGVELALL
jgi:hypothetical protein